MTAARWFGAKGKAYKRGWRDEKALLMAQGGFGTQVPANLPPSWGVPSGSMLKEGEKPAGWDTNLSFGAGDAFAPEGFDASAYFAGIDADVNGDVDAFGALAENLAAAPFDVQGEGAFAPEGLKPQSNVVFG